MILTCTSGFRNEALLGTEHLLCRKPILPKAIGVGLLLKATKKLSFFSSLRRASSAAQREAPKALLRRTNYFSLR